jgi:UDP-GlcNAc:undecaprenyl-phosphate GlcNAc-1-phosphate transferase
VATDIADYAIAGGVAGAVTLVTTPIVRALALRVGAVVAPDERRVHNRPTPTLGGLAMYLGFLAAMAAAGRLDAFQSLFRDNSEPLGVVLAATIIFAVGLVDDLHEMSAPAKITGMVVAGLVLAYFGVTMFYFRVPFLDVVALGQDLTPLVTVLWLIVMANAINLIDGLDGLAAGIVAIASGAFFLYGQRLDQLGLLATPNIGPLLAIVVLGLCLGFLPHNFNPARIFMGDSGALLLGLLMAASTSVVGGRADPNQAFSGQTYFFFAPLFIPLLILGVPLLDTMFAIVRRATRRQGVATADKDHLHHRLMRLGHGQRRSVLILWLWTALLSAFVLYPTYTGEGDAIVPIGILALGLALYTVLHPQVRRARSELE